MKTQRRARPLVQFDEPTVSKEERELDSEELLRRLADIEARAAKLKPLEGVIESKRGLASLVHDETEALQTERRELLYMMKRLEEAKVGRRDEGRSDKLWRTIRG